MAVRQEVIHSKKLEQALRSPEKFPINLEWMVDVFKYKHISSLTTHLKRHFKMNVHYKRFSQEQNKRVWTYFITVDCFIGICEYVRHAARKKIATVWLRKVGVKGSSRRAAPKDYEEYEPLSDDQSEFDEEGDEDEQVEEEGATEYYDEPDYDYYHERLSKRRRLEDDDEDYQCEEDDEEDDEERSYMQEMEEDASVEYDSEEYDSCSSSSVSSPNILRRSSVITVNTFNNQPVMYPSSDDNSDPLSLSSDSYSSASSSPASTPPSSPMANRFQLLGSNCIPASPLNISSGSISPPSISAPTPVKAMLPSTLISDSLPANMEMLKEQDWSYLHLRPTPPPSAEYTTKFSPSLMMNPQSYGYPQILPFNYYITPAAMHANNSLYLDPASFGIRPDVFHSDHPSLNLGLGEGQFDTNAFLSFPDEYHFASYQQ